MPPEQTAEQKREALIQSKINAGLTREGAIEVIKHQEENDARVAKERAAKEKNAKTEKKKDGE